jgi:hypothetical protein
MGKLSELLGRDEEQEFEGRTYALARLTVEMSAEWEEWLLQKARRALQRQRAVLLADEWAEESDRFSKDVVTGKYDFWSPASLDAMTKSLEGIEQMLFIRLTHARANKLTPEQARALARQMTEARLEAEIAKREAAKKNGKPAAAEEAADPFAASGPPSAGSSTSPTSSPSSPPTPSASPGTASAG